MAITTEVKQAIEAVYAYIQEGMLGRAEFEFGHLLMKNPSCPFVLSAIADFYYQNRNMRQAMFYMQKAKDLISADSALEEILYVSQMLSAVGEDEAANLMAIQAITIAVDDIERLQVANHLLKLDLLLQAIAIYESIEENILTDSVRTQYGMALLYTASVDNAEIQFLKALELNPKNILAAWQLAMLGSNVARENRIESLENLLNEAISDDEIFMIRFALFHEYQSSKQHAKAFQSLQIANELIVSTMNYQADLESSLVDDYLKQLKNLDFNESETVKFESPIPIFIVGLPRTGTTLMEKTICALADVQAVGEHLCFRKSIEHQLGIVFGSPFEIANLPFQNLLNFELLGKRYREKTRWKANNKPYYTDKEIFNFAFTGLIAKALPEARIIHIRRNPMDACFSGYKQKFGRGIYPASYSQTTLAEYYQMYERVMAFWRQALGSRMLEIRYEDLVLNHEQTVQIIKEYCQFKDVSEIHLQKPYMASTLSAAQVQKPIHSGNINAWAKYSDYLQPLRTALDKEYTEYMSGIEGVEIL